MAETATATPATPAPSTPNPETPPSTPVASGGSGSAPAVPSGASSPEGGTTLGSGGGTPDDKAAPQTFPYDWHSQMAGGDAELAKRLQRFATPMSFAKSWAEAQKKISAGQVPTPRPDGKDEAALNAWRQERGVPEKPEGYLEKVPNGLVIGEADKPLIDAYLKRAHARDASPAEVHDSIAFIYEYQQKVAEERAQIDKEHRQQSEDALRGDWGQEYRGNLNAINSVFKTMAPDGLMEKFYSARFADGTPLGDDPDTLKFLATMANKLNPRGIVTPSQGHSIAQTIETELKQLQTEMRDTKGAQYDYWKNPAKQARYRELLEAQQQHTRAA